MDSFTIGILVLTFLVAATGFLCRSKAAKWLLLVGLVFAVVPPLAFVATEVLFDPTDCSGNFLKGISCPPSTPGVRAAGNLFGISMLSLMANMFIWPFAVFAALILEVRERRRG